MAEKDGETVAASPTFNFKQAISQMVQRAASDLLLKVGRPPAIRLNGELNSLNMAPLRPEDLKALAEQIMTPRQIKEFAERKEADFAIGVPGVGRFRTNIYQQRGTLAFALRSIPYEVKTIQELNLPEVLEEVSLKPRGLVLVTGVTGSGKSTALAAMMNHINRHRRVNIITIEDPIEYQLGGIGQIQVNPRIDLTFANGLRSILRQDPDIIMVGEIRDRETAEIAIQASLTGHLVFSTLHTNDAAGAVTRLLDMGVEAFLVSSSVIAIIAQRLVRVICRECREPYRPDLPLVKEIGLDRSSETAFDGFFYRGKGCLACFQTGYRGRSGIYELLVIDDNIRGLVMSGADSNVIRRKAIEQGMTTLFRDGIDKIVKGTTTVDEVLRVTQE
jgi:pilus retraction protein PilT